jgi:hypothetical protein
MSNFLDFATPFDLPPSDAGGRSVRAPAEDDLLLHRGIDGFQRQKR